LPSVRGPLGFRHLNSGPALKVSEVFISYARSTEREAGQVAESLRALGWGVWRDDELPAHRPYAEVIKERLEASKAVVVLWSAEAAESEWVRSEAERARTDRKLVQLSLDKSVPPMPFDQIQCADLSGWTGGEAHPGWSKVVASIRALAGNPAPRADGAPAPAAKARLSVAVLPFANISGDPEQEYFSDGITEDITTDLSKVSALSVASRNTAFTFKNKAVNLAEVARTLGVTHVLEGSVRKAGNRIRITAQLIEGATDSHVWAERYDRELDDIFAIQDEISRAIVAALKVKLAPEEGAAIAQRSTTNPDAYEFYLMARRYWLGGWARRRELIARLCQKAIDLDPNYALAWSLMSMALSDVRFQSPSTVGDQGWVAAERALSLDPNLAEAHAAKGRILSDRGRYDEAQAEHEIALRLDPASYEVNVAAARWAVATRRHREAIAFLDAAARADSADYWAPGMAIQCYEALGDKPGAQAVARETMKRIEALIATEPDNGGALSFGASALVTLGDGERARKWGEHALLLDPTNNQLRYNLACAMVRAGDTDYAIDLLQESLKVSGLEGYNWALRDNDLDSLRALPRFTAILAEAATRLGLE
jgi:adenylate cyclase